MDERRDTTTWENNFASVKKFRIERDSHSNIAYHCLLVCIMSCLHASSHGVVRNDILGDVSDRAEGVLHQVGGEVNVALHHARDLVDDRHPGLLDELLRPVRTFFFF